MTRPTLPAKLPTSTDAKPRERRPLPPVTMRKNDNPRAVQLEVREEDRDTYAEQLLNLFGTVEHHAADSRILEMLKIQPRAVLSSEAGNVRFRDFLAFMSGVAPKDDVEAALGTQMYAVHAAAMDMAANMSASQNPEQAMGYGALMVKLTRTFAAQTEALTKLRTGGKQEIRVIHVQNIGDVNFNGVDGGGDFETGGQPHEPGTPGVTIEARAPVWSAQPSGLALSGAGHAREEAMPGPRRKKSRRTQGPS